ncbi:MAG: hypothetical protein SF052_22085 [Bacteroidia bacterium]|nr:hypothetical protein [Bacteroidia bacterium]
MKNFSILLLLALAVFTQNVNAREITGNEPAAQTETVVYENVYFNIDLVVYSEVEAGAKSVKYEFVVYPGGDPREISMTFSREDEKVLEDGKVIISGNVADLITNTPQAFQENGLGEIEAVEAGFEVKGNNLNLTTGNYEQAQILTITYQQKSILP